MTIINGMEIQPELVDYLKTMCYNDADNNVTSFDSHVDDLSELSDFMIDVFDGAYPEANSEKTVIMYLSKIKYAKDCMKKLSALMKQCKVEPPKYE